MAPIHGIILIDEISMVSSVMLADIIGFQQLTKYKLVLFGDFLQLPPIVGEFVFQYPSFNDVFCIYKLTQIMRHCELDFIRILNHTAWNEFPPFVIRFLLQRGYAYTQLTEQEKNDKLHLYYERKHVDNYNKLCFDSIPEPTTYYPIEIVSRTKHVYANGNLIRTKTRLRCTEEEIAQSTKLMQEYHLEPVVLKRNCWIMFTRNLYTIYDAKHQLVPIRNGTRALVIDVNALGITVWMQDYGFVTIPKQVISLGWTRVTSERLKIGCGVMYDNNKIGTVMDLLEGNFVSIKTDENIELRSGSVVRVIPREKRYSFQFECLPCVLSYALTIHKSQGMTLDHVVLHMDSLPNCHLLYVALSRCRSKNGVYIAGNFVKPRSGIEDTVRKFYSMHKMR